jgi:hypothetical protein
VTRHKFCYNVVKFQIENDTIYRVADNLEDLFKSVIIPYSHHPFSTHIAHFDYCLSDNFNWNSCIRYVMKFFLPSPSRRQIFPLWGEYGSFLDDPFSSKNNQISNQNIYNLQGCAPPPPRKYVLNSKFITGVGYFKLSSLKNRGLTRRK